MKLTEYRKISKDVATAIEKALAPFGLKPQPFGAKIDERLGQVHIKLILADLNLKAADGSATTPEAELYKRHYLLYDLKLEWLGRSFSMGRKEFTIRGMKPRGQKNILIENDGKTYVATPEQVRVYITASLKSLGPAENVGSTTDQARDARPLGELLGK